MDEEQWAGIADWVDILKCAHPECMGNAFLSIRAKVPVGRPSQSVRATQSRRTDPPFWCFHKSSPGSCRGWGDLACLALDRNLVTDTIEPSCL